MGASDKLFYWLFQQHPDRILELLPELAARFSAPVLKERERRLDGLLQAPEEQPQRPALILEAQMHPIPASCGAFTWRARC